MIPARTIFALALLSATASGCASDPLVGRWAASTPHSGYVLTTTLTFNNDSTLTVTDAGTGACAGSRTYTGLTWSSSPAMTVTFSGASVCTGTITCVVAGVTETIGCPPGPPPQMTGACGYTMSADTNALTLSRCSGSGGTTTYVRTGS